MSEADGVDPAVAGVRVLVVDDHEMFVEAMTRALADESDIEVVGSSDSVAGAVECAERERPDVVLMDQQLTDGLGVEATRAIKAAHPEIKVVMLTSVTDDEVLLAAVEAGCSGYVTKHGGIAEVVAAVHAAHAGDMLISPSVLARLLPAIVHRPAPRSPDLTPRELEVLELLAAGLATQDLADRLAVSIHTARNHVQSILTKLQVHSKLEAVATAVREGLITYH